MAEIGEVVIPVRIETRIAFLFHAVAWVSAAVGFATGFIIGRV